MQKTSLLLALSISAPLILAACSGSDASGGSGSGGGSGSSTGSGQGAGSTTSGPGTTSSTSTGSGTTTTSSSSGGNSGACPIFPSDNPWNTDISKAKVDPLSDQYIASIGGAVALHPDFGHATDSGIPYVYVDNSEMKSTVKFQYAKESDPGPYPIPASPPVEASGDAHILMIQTDECKLYEIFAADKQADGWHAGSGAIWDLKSNALRPDGWTSADAAGLPILAGLAKYGEASKGMMKHALRFTAESTQSAYASPARHSSGDGANKSLPPMGMRVRLKASFDTSKLTPQAKWVADTLKTYGMMLADNGGNWYITGAGDAGWDDNDLHNLNKIHGTDLEVIETGPLTPGD